MTLLKGQQIITTHILPNISKSKGNQAMEFGQLIKYNIFFLKNHRNQFLFVFLKRPYIASGKYLFQNIFS